MDSETNPVSVERESGSVAKSDSEGHCSLVEHPAVWKHPRSGTEHCSEQLLGLN